MKFHIVLLIVAVLVVLSNCRKRKHGHKRKTYTEDGKKRELIESESRYKLHKRLTKGQSWKTVPAEKRSKYDTAFLDEYEPHNKDTDDGKDIVSNYATENTPLFWKDIEEDKESKKEEEGLPPEGFQQQEDELPSTVGPNENIYGGFPINDVLGGFELPSPETLAILKLALKQHGPRNEYEAKLHHDLENWAYGYEHHALPEYDIKETPPFYVAMLEGLKMMEENKKKPSAGCKGGKAGCGPMIQLNDDQCNTLAGNCMPSKPVTSEAFEKPCPWKILEMLYGCKKPKAPAASEKPESAEPPLPKPDKPEEPAEAKPEKPEEPKPEKPVEAKPVKPEEPSPAKPAPQEPENNEKTKKPKPIPIEFPAANENKLAPDIKDDDSDTRGTNAAQPNAKLQEELGILGMLSDNVSPKKAPLSQTGVSGKVSGVPESTANSTTAENKNANQVADISLEVESGQTPAVMESELTTKGKPEPAKTPPLETGNKTSGKAHKNVLDLSFLASPQAIQLGSLKGQELELVYPNKEKLFIKLPSPKDLSQRTGLQRSIRMRTRTGRKYGRYKIVESEPDSSSKAVRKHAGHSTAKGTKGKLGAGDKTAKQGSRQPTILTTSEVSAHDISPVIASLGKELESRLNKKLKKLDNGNTSFTISVGISPENIGSRRNNVGSAERNERKETVNRKNDSGKASKMK